MTFSTITIAFTLINHDQPLLCHESAIFVRVSTGHQQPISEALAWWKVANLGGRSRLWAHGHWRFELAMLPKLTVGWGWVQVEQHKQLNRYHTYLRWRWQLFKVKHHKLVQLTTYTHKKNNLRTFDVPIRRCKHRMKILVMFECQADRLNPTAGT